MAVPKEPEPLIVTGKAQYPMKCDCQRLRLKIQSILKVLFREGVVYFVCRVSSHGRQHQGADRKIWTIPNMITIGRICFCPVLAGLIMTAQHELALLGELELSAARVYRR